MASSEGGSSIPVEAFTVEDGGQRPEAASRSRRRFLQVMAASAAAGAVGAVLAPPSSRSAGASTLAPEETQRLRESFTRQALAERRTAGGAALADPPPPKLSLPAAAPAGAAPAGATPSPSLAALPSESLLTRMQRELRKALAKPAAERKWVMVIDLRKCIGCSACTVACKAENHLPPGVVYRPVIEEEVGEFPNVSRRWLPRPCMQCEDPPCVTVCPVRATWKQEDGIVVIDYNACIGCRYCITACPYGARYFDFGDNYTDDTPAVQAYEESAAPEYGREWPRDGGSPVGNVRKCQFCLHRLNVGMLPACVTTCIGAATFFGDKNDPESLVSELAASPNVMRLKEDLGTEPKVYYLT